MRNVNKLILLFVSVFVLACESHHRVPQHIEIQDITNDFLAKSSGAFSNIFGERLVITHGEESKKIFFKKIKKLKSGLYCSLNLQGDIQRVYNYKKGAIGPNKEIIPGADFEETKRAHLEYSVNDIEVKDMELNHAITKLKTPEQKKGCDKWLEHFKLGGTHTLKLELNTEEKMVLALENDYDFIFEPQKVSFKSRMAQIFVNEIKSHVSIMDQLRNYESIQFNSSVSMKEHQVVNKEDVDKSVGGVFKLDFSASGKNTTALSLGVRSCDERLTYTEMNNMWLVLGDDFQESYILFEYNKSNKAQKELNDNLSCKDKLLLTALPQKMSLDLFSRSKVTLETGDEMNLYLKTQYKKTYHYKRRDSKPLP